MQEHCPKVKLRLRSQLPEEEFPEGLQEFPKLREGSKRILVSLKAALIDVQ